MTVLISLRVPADDSVQRVFAMRLCAKNVPEDVGSGDLSDFVDCGISNFRVSNSRWGSTTPPGTI
jgi:hypothetical protein